MSRILSQILKDKLPDWNEVVFNEAISYEVCAASGVSVIEADVKSQGEYVIHDGYPVIILKKRITPQMRLWVLLHELGHHLLHYPDAHWFSKSKCMKIDRESNFFAAIAMMPTWLVKSKTPSEIARDFDYPEEIIEIRREITVNFRI